jgi:hypothetical protein
MEEPNMKTRHPANSGSHRCGLPPSRSRSRAAGLLLALAWVAAGAAQAQSGLLGLPLDNFQFKASHNACQQDEDLDDQIDNYNVWCVELDLQWETDCGPCITVDHTDSCCDGEQRLHESIAEILLSTESSQRITFIWLDIKDSGNSLVHEAWPDNRRELIRDGMLALGAEKIYTKSEFDMNFSTNGGHWPSWQQLQADGKEFILVLEDRVDPSGQTNDPVFFIAVDSLQDATNGYSWATFINIEGADTSKGIPMPNDRWIYRAWFGPGTIDTSTWETAAARGFNLINSDDIDHGYTITDSRTHSPQPLYVNRLAFTADRLWGTRNYPMNHLPSAIARASPGTTLRIHPGDYPAPVTFAKPLRVQRQPGSVGVVRIGTP